MTNKLRVAVIGAGRWSAEAHLPGWQRSPLCDLVTVCDLERELAELTAEMQDPAMAVDHTRLGKLIDKHTELQSELDDCLERWETLQELLAANGDS